MTYTEIYFLSGTLAYTWVHFLTPPGEVFDFVENVNISPKLRKVLYECDKCVAGQLALWMGFIPLVSNTYSIRHHFITVLFVIFTLGVIGQIKQLCNQQ